MYHRLLTMYYSLFTQNPSMFRNGWWPWSRPWMSVIVFQACDARSCPPATLAYGTIVPVLVACFQERSTWFASYRTGVPYKVQRIPSRRVSSICHVKIWDLNVEAIPWHHPFSDAVIGWNPNWLQIESELKQEPTFEYTANCILRVRVWHASYSNGLR